MYKIHRASKNGVQVRTFGWDTDIREIRSEAERVKMEQEVDASIALQRQILMTICTGLEYVNKRYDYLDLELDGWSESIMEDLPRYDLIFEKLHKKHAGKVSMPVELQLILMIGGSAMTYHMVNKGRKARFEEPRRRKKSKSKKKRKPTYDSDASDGSERTKLRRKYSKPASESAPGKREMKGPTGLGGLGGMDMGMMGGLGGLGGLGGMAAMSMLPQMPMPSMNMPEMTRNAPPPTATVDSLDSAEPELPETEPEDPQEDRRLMQASPIPEEPEDDDSAGDRLSDIPSEELNEMMEANLDAMSPVPDDTKVIELDDEPKGKGKGKKRGGRKKKDESKNVVVI